MSLNHLVEYVYKNNEIKYNQSLRKIFIDKVNNTQEVNVLIDEILDSEKKEISLKFTLDSVIPHNGIKPRNIFVISHNNKDSLFAEGKFISSQDILKNKIKEFIINENIQHSQKKRVNVDYFG